MNLKLLKNFAVRLILAAFFSALPGGAQDSPPSEYQVKAAFLYNFTKYVQWPEQSFAGAETRLDIAILGKNPFGNDLERTLKNKSIQGHVLVIKTPASVTDPELKRCHILYICQDEKKHLPEILAALKGSNVLTVSDGEAAGVMINFVMEGNKVRFEINDEAAKEAQLNISSKLLNLARKKKAGAQ